MSAARHRLRAATYADVEQVADLLREVSFKARSEAGWRWLFEENPAHRRQDPPPPMGWVLERDGVVDGYLGNVHLDYVLDGRPLRAATCTSYYVRPHARGDSVRLMNSFFEQPGVELFLTTTANAMSDPVYRLFKAEVPADPSFAEGLVWVADDRVALRDAIAQLGVPRGVAEGLGTLGAPASFCLRYLGGFAVPRIGVAREPVLVLTVEQLDERFDRLWEHVAAAPGLRVRRDASTLRWYFRDPDAGGEPALFALIDAEGVVGYAAAARHHPPGTTPSQLRILDFVVRPGGERAVPALLVRMIEHARESKVGLVYCPPCGAALAGELRALRPRRHRHEYAAHFLRAARRAETANLTRCGVWQATSLDGDTPFCIENTERIS